MGEIADGTRRINYDYNAFDDITSTTVTPGPGTSVNSTTSYNYITQQLNSGLIFDELSSVADNLGDTTKYGYDPSGTGNLASVTDATGARVWNYTYWGNGELKTAADPDGNPPSSFTYASPSGDLLTATDPLNETTTYATDGVGRVTSVTSPLGAYTQYHYDALSDVTAVIDPDGFQTTMAYDLLGELTGTEQPNGDTWTTTRPGSLATITNCDPSQNCSVTDFDGIGRKTDYTDRRGIKTTISYDYLGRKQSEVFNANGKANFTKRTLTYQTYDQFDELQALEDSGGGLPSSPGNNINYTYDGVGNIASENATYSGYNSTVSYGYDGIGRETSMIQSPSWGGGVTYSYGYDPDNELISISGGAVPVPVIGYDKDGNRKYITETFNSGSIVTCYGYDPVSRLTSQEYTTGSPSNCEPNFTIGNLAYGYDHDGHLNSVTGSLANLNLPASMIAGSIAYSPTGQVSQWNSTSLVNSTDAASNLGLDPSTGNTYNWDARNQLTTGVSSGSNLTFEHDAVGRLEDDTNGSATLSYLLDGGQTISSLLSTGSVASTFERDPSTGEVLGFAQGSTLLIPLHDGRGSTLGLVGASNNIQTSYIYDPTGNVTVTGGGNSPAFPFLYQGAQAGDWTGLYGDPYSTGLMHNIDGGSTPYSGYRAAHGVPAFPISDWGGEKTASIHRRRGVLSSLGAQVGLPERVAGCQASSSALAVATAFHFRYRPSRTSAKPTRSMRCSPASSKRYCPITTIPSIQWVSSMSAICNRLHLALHPGISRAETDPFHFITIAAH